MRLPNDVIESIRLMAVDGNRLELPAKKIDNYSAVRRVLLKAGGVYKKNGFVFADPAEIQARLTCGEVVNDKKKFQEFFTPPEVADLLIREARIEDHTRVLEPSAGQGALARLIEARYKVTVECVELQAKNTDVLESKGLHVVQGDFLKLHPAHLGGSFDRIVANPPFSNNQDIDHVTHMADFLAEGGRLVSLMSMNWCAGSQRKQIAFRYRLDALGAEITQVPEGMFKQSGTMVPTCVVRIDRSW